MKELEFSCGKQKEYGNVLNVKQFKKKKDKLPPNAQVVKTRVKMILD